jgi:outer membrane receptor for ferrienterochelin and colicin
MPIVSKNLPGPSGDHATCRYASLVIVLAALLAFSVVPGLAGITGILEGRVADKQTHDPVAGANILIDGTSIGSAADPEGLYLIPNIRSGVYSVRISAIGYGTIVMRNVTILPDLRTRIDIELDAAAVELEAIEVTAERSLIQKDLPATAYSIGEIKLNKLPVTAFQEVLGLQPGTTMEGNVRGGKTNEVMYLIDGLPVQDVVAGGLGMSIPRSAITGMTIHTGGFEAQYGNAMSGVVNVVTKTGTNERAYTIRLERDGWLGTYINEQQDRLSELEVSGRGPVVNDRLFYFAAGTATTSDTRWWQDFDRFNLSPVSRKFTGFGKMEFVATPSLRLALQGVLSLDRWKDYQFSWRFNLPGLPPLSRDAYRMSLSASHTLSEKIFYTVSLSRYFHRSGIGTNIGDADSLQPYEYDFFLRYIIGGRRYWWADTRQIVYTFKGDVTAQISRSHIVKAGVELNQYSINSHVAKYEPQTTYFGKPIAGAQFLNYSNAYAYRPRSGSVFAQLKSELEHDGSNISFGVRWDFLDPTADRPVVEFIPVNPDEYRQAVKGYVPAKFKQQFSPRIALAVPMGTSSFFFMNFGHYFQYPLFDYLYSGINPARLRAGTRSVLTGNPDLSPERTIAWEMGLKQSLSRTMVASVTYFRKSIHNQIDSKTLIPFDSKAAGDFGFASYVNNAQAEINGIEVVLSRERGERLTGTLSYSYMVTEGLSDNANQTINLSQWGFPIAALSFPLSWDQRHTIKGEVDFMAIWGININAVLLFNSPRPYTYYPTRDGFTPLDSTKSFLPNNARMANNLFINTKLTKDFVLGSAPGSIRLTLYADVRNLLNSENVKWIDSNGRIGGELGDPGAYYDGRRIRIGLQVER